MRDIILNLGSGNTKPFGYPDQTKTMLDILINVDTSYLNIPTDDIELIHSVILNPGSALKSEYFTDTSAFAFLSEIVGKVDKVVAYRFLEHIEHTQVPYMLYLIGNVLKKDGEFEFIVPDYLKLSKFLIANDNPKKADFNNVTTLLTYEMLADPYCPHCSLWTKNRAEALLTAENIFEVDEIVEDYQAFGRNIYLHVTARKSW